MKARVSVDPFYYNLQAKEGKRITYKELAKRAGIPIATFNRMREGVRLLNIRRVVQLAGILGCDWKELVVITEE